MPNCEIISGGVKIAEKTKIPIKKYFLFFFKLFTLKILNFVSIISKTGNSNDSPHDKSNNIVSFIYSEYRDSSSTFKPSLKKFSKERKKLHMKGIRT